LWSCGAKALAYQGWFSTALAILSTWEEIDVHEDHGAKGRNAEIGSGHIAGSYPALCLPFENVLRKFTVLYNDLSDVEIKYVKGRDTVKQGLFTE
jgi:hypothetical protein